MSPKLSILIIILFLLPVFLFLLIQPTPLTPLEVSTFSIINKDKETLLEYSYKILDGYFAKSAGFPPIPDLLGSDINYNILFITILNDGKVRGCQSGSNPVDSENRIFMDIREAVIESIEDDRFDGALEEYELVDVQIMFTFLYDITYLANNSLRFLKNNIELGIHSIEILYDDTPIIFKESVPISNNYDHEYLLQRLCNKAELDENCYSRDDIKIYRFGTLTFKGDRQNSITDLYRYSILVNEEDINSNIILNSIKSGRNWYLNTVNTETNLLEYQYYPSDDYYSTDNNHVRQLASLWALTELDTFFKNNLTEDLVFDTLDYYLQFKNTTHNYSFLTIDEQSKLTNNAFLILSLINTPNYPNQSKLLEEFADGIISLQQENGSYNTYFFSDLNTGIDYYPGEAMLSLMKYYDYTKEKKYLDSVQKAFYFYKPYWQDNKNTAFIPWHSQTYKLLYNETKEPEIAEFVFEMNDWMIDSYQISSSEYIDEIGGFPSYTPTFSTSVFLEGINDAYAIAVQTNDQTHIDKYDRAIRSGIRFVLQTQFTEENAFYVDNKTKTVGGFKTSLVDNSIRIDNTQHGLMALIKTYENNIFN